jgi:hypothetical protein
VSATLARAAVIPGPGPGPAPGPGPNPDPGGGGGGGGEGGQSGGDAKASTPVSLALKLKFVHQEERKHVTIRYDRQEAETRTYGPMANFPLLLDELADRDTHFFEVDGDAPFFRQMTITAAAPFDLAALGIVSAQVAIDYGDPAAPDHRHADFVFTPADRGDRSTSFFLNRAADTAYTQTVTYHFDPTAWDGHDVALETGPTVTRDRTLLLNPFEHAEFLTVGVEPGRIDAGLVRAVDVRLSVATSGEPVRRTFTVRPGSAPQAWKVRTDLVGERQYTVTTTAHLTDGSTHETAPVTTSAPLLLVDDPFEDAIEIELVPALDPAADRLAIVDVAYDDEPHAYHRSERVTVPADRRDPLALRLAILDPTRRELSYRVTVVGLDGSVRRGAWQPTTETVLSVS